MGQYYRIALRLVDDISRQTIYSDRKVNGADYVMAKLMEHSYFGNRLMDAVAKNLEDYNTKLAWIGDYATPSEVGKITHTEAKYRDCWGWTTKKGNEICDKCRTEFPSVHFSYRGKYLINNYKKLYISFDNYRKRCRKLGADKNWELNPISILTAIGNGRGGGDYCGTYDKYVGKWAWDNITISNKKPSGFTELKIAFVEGAFTEGDE